MSLSKSETPMVVLSLSKLMNIPIVSAGWDLRLPSINLLNGNKAVIGELITPDCEFCEDYLEDDELLERVCSLERIIQSRPLENILAIDENGNVIMHIIGEHNKVSMDWDYWNSAKVITHNHPNGATLSGTDVSHLFDTECQEIRACSFNTWYSVKLTDETEDLDAETVEQELSQILNDEVVKSVVNSCSHNGLDVTFDFEKKKVKPMKPEKMSTDEFVKRVTQSKKEQHILSIVYTHKAMRNYTKVNKIKYEVGEL